mgnify:CR=1 FL=1
MSTQSLIIIGETGASYLINSISELKSVCENYFKQLGITQNDISIVNNVDQNFIYLNNLEYKPDSKYFIFSKRYNNKLLQIFRTYQTKNNIDLLSSIGTVSINIPNISKFLYILEQNKEYLSCSLEEIKQAYETMISYYNKFNSIYINFKSNVKSVNKIKDYFKYQNEGVELMNNIAMLKFEKCFKKYEDFVKESDNTKKNNDVILQNYMDNIDRLKKMELPDSFIKYISKKKKTNNIKYLIDIYYKENDMNVWRDNCLNKQECLFNKVKTKDKILQKEKIQINKDTNAFLTPLKNGWNLYISEYEKVYKEKNNYILSLLNDINNDFTSFNNILGQMKEIFESKLLNSNPVYLNTLKESCIKILSYKEKYSDLNILSSLSNYIQPFKDYANKMNNSIDNSSKKINDYFMNIRAIKNILEKLADKMGGYSKALKNIEEDFKFLETPGRFINSYGNTLLELKRRNNFNNEIQEEIIKIKALMNNENYQRKKFIEENKKYLTPDFIKLFKLENKPIFNYTLMNNNEHSELSMLLSDENLENNKTSIYVNESSTMNNNNFETTGKFSDTNNTNNNNFNKKLYQDLMNQISELDIKLKSKEKELIETQNKYKQIENNFSELDKDISNFYTSFDEISDIFNSELSQKDQQIEELTKKIENINKTLSFESNGNNIIQSINCPLCKEIASSGSNYKNIDSAFQDLKQEINKYKKKLNDLDSNYRKLIYNTITIKKGFFNHMNMIITKKNLEMSKFKERQEEKEMYMEDVLSAEKIFNKNSINQEFGKLNNKIKDYKLTINDNNEKINNYEKINKELKSKEVLLKTQLEKIIQKNEKLSDNNIELTKELRQKYQDNSDLAKLLEQSKKEQVESIKKLDLAHQADIDCLKIKLKELSENIKEKENEDSKKYQQYINMKEKFSHLLKEKEMHLQQIKELSLDIREKNKKIDELLQTQESTNTDLNLSLQNDDDIIFYKKIDKGLRCIFVPFYENIFVCINLSQNLERGKGENDIYNLSNYECKYILDLNSFNKELSKMIVDYSLIVIGKISKLTELEQSKNKFLNLPENKQYILVTLGKIDYVIGFPENELMFNNYVN